MPKMNETNHIGINSEKAQELALQLNELLSYYQIFYMNVRGFHWNIKGHKFFELHLKFEELYNDLLIKIDEIAERVLTLGYAPTHAYSDYLDISIVKEAKNISQGDTAVKSILDSLKLIIEKERTLLNLSDETDDEGTNALMSDYIREQEKLVWMYRAYLS